MSKDNNDNFSFTDKFKKQAPVDLKKDNSKESLQKKPFDAADFAKAASNMANKNNMLDLDSEQRIQELLKIVWNKLQTPDFINAFSVEEMQAMEKEVEELCNLIDGLSRIVATRYQKYLRKILDELSNQQKILAKQMEQSNVDDFEELSNKVYSELDNLFGEHISGDNYQVTHKENNEESDDNKGNDK